MSQKPSSPSDNSAQPFRARSNSLLRLMSNQNSPISSPTQQKQTDFKRSMSMSEGLHVRLPMLHHSETEPFPYSPISQEKTNNICPSESNWANKYDDFDIGKPIGYGSSAVVYEAIYKPLRKRVAIKMIDLDMFERNQIDELRRETALMALSKHPNVLRVYGSFVNGSKLYIVTPYLAAGSCLDIMKTAFPDGLDEVSIASILLQALKGLIYLHKNGHIHRDVKAGNLLMDQQGTVLLADFGVSSSLAEKGDVRKTFVGTPCWMAPEVMEQAGYDYKADIWSFGITALELATGHAPFAKYPPMKVLMMTLSNDPPTLDREGGKHKYYKAFKDMIDSCLQKEPSKRPSAEKLILHPFFKQAKKRDYLVKSILSYIQPLDQRPHKKVPLKHISSESTEQWDFDTPSGNELAIHDLQQKQSSLITPQQQTEVSGLQTSNPLERSRSMVQFEECPKPSHLDRAKSIGNTQNTDGEQPPKKHISFGDVVIKDSSSATRSVISPVSENLAPIMNGASTSSINSEPGFATYEPPTLKSAPTSKKSRFVVEDGHPITTTNSTASESTTPPNHSPLSATDTSAAAAAAAVAASVGLGICTTPLSIATANSNTIPGSNNPATPISSTVPSAASLAANISSNNNTIQECEVKKGRFSVNQTPTPRPGTPSGDELNSCSLDRISSQHSVSEFKPTPISRAASQDSFSERKSRFEVKHSNNNNGTSTPISVASTPIEPNTPSQSLPMTRENSNTSALSRDSSVNYNKISRFSIEKPTTAATAATTTATTTEASGPCCEVPVATTAAINMSMSPECRKKGRFELTGGSNAPNDVSNMSSGKSEKEGMHSDSPQSTVGPSPVISPSNSLSRGQAYRIVDTSASPNLVLSHMESLLKQTEIQKNMLQDLISTMPIMYNQHSTSSISRARTISDSKKPTHNIRNEEFYQRAPTSNPNTSSASSTTSTVPSLATDITATVEHLQQLFINSNKEKERLTKENEALRREVERLRNSNNSNKQQHHQQQPGSILKKQPSGVLDSSPSIENSFVKTVNSNTPVALEATAPQPQPDKKSPQ